MKTLFALSSFILTSFYSFSQVGINTTTPNAAFDVISSTQGVLIPRVALTSLNVAAPVVNPAGGALAVSTMIFHNGANSIAAGYYYWDGTRWVTFSGNDWNLLGNTAIISPIAPTVYGTTSIGIAENFLGTKDANDLVFGTNNLERFRVMRTTGNIGIGTATPSYKFTVLDNSNSFTAGWFQNTYVGNVYNRGIVAQSINNPGYGYGAYLVGGYVGADILANSTSSTNWTYGIISRATGTAGGRVGAWIDASGGANNYGIIVPGTTANIRNGFGTAGPEQMLSVAQGVNIDQSALNNGTITSGLSFGSGSGEGFGSKRTAGGNQYGLDFYQGFANRMRIWNDGRVAIGVRNDGTINPDANLSVMDPTAANVDVQVFSAIKGGTAGSRWRMGSVEYYTEGLGNIGYSSNVSPLDANGWYDLGSSWGTNYDGWRWRILYTTGGVNTSSDIRLKEDIQPLIYGLESIRKIETISYKMKDDKLPNGKNIANVDKRVHLGFNAQQLQEVLPEVVSSSDFITVDEKEYVKAQTPTLGVYYSEIIPITVKAIQDLDRQQQQLIKTINITDFGIEETKNNEIVISFSEEFISQLKGKPVVTITSLEPNVFLQLYNVTSTGFSVKNLSGTNSMNFNWIAIAKIKTEIYKQNQSYSDELHQSKVAKIKSETASLPTIQDIQSIRKSKEVNISKVDTLTEDQKKTKSEAEKLRVKAIELEKEITKSFNAKTE